jgi:FAD/FMN-containing dehydrogenase
VNGSVPRRRHPSRLSGWGRFPVVDGYERQGEDLAQLAPGAILSRGLGRSYGDASLPPSRDYPVLNTTLADRLLAFDPETGRLRAEAGLSLRELNRIFLPRGYFTPVTPGTQYVTLGGMVAADVHGKNHHVAGSFGEYVEALRMVVADGRVLEVTEEREPELFRATLGGMGLTGHILEVQFRMQPIPSPWIWQESQRVPSLDALIAMLRTASQEWPYTVGWVDCPKGGSEQGRGIIYCGRWAKAAEAPPHPPRSKRRLTVPFTFPEWVLCARTARLVNDLIFLKHGGRVRRGIISPEVFFYPLDAVLCWNRLYGHRGFTQYQCVLPPSTDGSTYRRFFDLFTSKGGTALLCVIKDCGAEGKGTLSFLKPGISIAFDMAIRGQHTRDLINALNELVIELGGRVYLAKDAFTRAAHYRAMDPRLPTWEAARRRWDPERQLRSAQSVRLLGDPA